MFKVWVVLHCSAMQDSLHIALQESSESKTIIYVAKRGALKWTKRKTFRHFWSERDRIKTFSDHLEHILGIVNIEEQNGPTHWALAYNADDKK